MMTHAEAAELEFSSPCLGILFSLYDVIKDLEVDESKFSSPCLGILFSPYR